MPVISFIALGSNLGDRQEYLNHALAFLRVTAGIIVRKVSSYHETEPVGGPPGQPRYLNAAAELETDLSPEDLLLHLLDIESKLGRVRGERFGPRTIDLDLLLYGEGVYDVHTAELDLTVPHPRMHERGFVLEPLAEIAPLAVHPVLGSTIRDLLRQLRGESCRELQGQRALVTGSTSGIGRAIALELASAGADVVVHGRRSRATAEESAAAIRQHGVRSEILLADLRDVKACKQLVAEAWQHWGGLDIWINNAGADTLTGEAARWSFERKLQELLAVDVAATMILSREIGQRMKTAGRGVLINMGWDQAETGMEGDSGQLFAASKGAVMACTKSLALSLAPEVRVNCLAPGWIKTAWGKTASASWQERAVREAPLGRWGTPEDVAKVARWLASPAAAFVTGQIIRVNGGAVR
jgi:2-amino-4-hydroxy-6-hydroxymethyldihydropteridine diphosphokinase